MIGPTTRVVALYIEFVDPMSPGPRMLQNGVAILIDLVCFDQLIPIGVDVFAVLGPQLVGDFG